MKKSLLALAAMGAFAGAAQAQSSVTVYGIIDAGFSSTSSRVGTNKATNAGFIQNGNGNETSSRLGFRGTEDLGGGTSAFFTVELELSNTSSTQVLNGNRQTFVGLAKKGIGRAAIGTQYTVLHDSVAATDPGESNNVVGSIIRPVGYATTATQNLPLMGNDGAGGNHMVRTTNMLKFNSDKFAGLGVNLAYIQNNANSRQTATGTNAAAGTGGSNNFMGWNVGLDYRIQKLFVVAAYGSIKQEQNASAGITASTITFPSTIISGTNANTTQNNTYVGAVYDFGILKAYAAWTNSKLTNDYNSNQYLKRSGQQLGVRGYVTKTVEGWASVGNGKLQSYGTNQPTANFNAFQLGSNYWLSKRTNLYAIYGQAITSSTSNNLGGAGNSQYAMGLRHTF